MGSKCTIGNINDINECPSEGSVFFSPEYAYMEGYDVFPGGHWYAVDVFTPCNTDLFFYDDDIISPAVDVKMANKQNSGVWEVNYEHDDNRCVMSNWPYSMCTLYDVTTDLHFCPADQERIKCVTW